MEHKVDAQGTLCLYAGTYSRMAEGKVVAREAVNHVIEIKPQDGCYLVSVAEVKPDGSRVLRFAPKKMQMVKAEGDEVELEGVDDEVGDLHLHDYELHIHLEHGMLMEVVLHLHDRGMEIVYEK